MCKNKKTLYIVTREEDGSFVKQYDNYDDARRDVSQFAQIYNYGMYRVLTYPTYHVIDCGPKSFRISCQSFDEDAFITPEMDFHLYGGNN